MEPRDKVLLGVSSNILLLGVVSFFTDISTELIMSVLPTFLVISLGATPEIVGTIEGIAESMTSFLKLVSGAIADRTGKKKRLTIIGYTLSNITKPIMGFATSWSDVLVLRIGDRVGKGLRTAPRDAMIADSADSRIGRSFGIHRTLDQLGAIVGPVLAFVLLIPLGYGGIFLFTAIPGAIAIAMLVLFVKEPPSKSRQNKAILKNARAIMNRGFSMYIVSATFYAASAISYAFILLRAIEVGIPVEMTALVYALIQIFHVFSGVPAGEISDRFGRVRAVQVGYFLLLAAFATIAVSSELWLFLFGVVLFGMHQGTVETSQRAVIPSLTKEEFKGTAYGVYNMAVGAVALPTNILAGFIFSSLGSQYAFLYGSILALFASLAMAATERMLKQDAGKGRER
ncbi:MAG: MFS transporter [Candidatus Methanosuratincola sp.]|jgi:MFS family permease|nr:MFS transporter [Candidatus Methanosuratincola sp.]